MHKHFGRALATATAAALTGGLLTFATAAPATAATGQYAADFNGDGYKDAVATAPQASVGGKWWSGAVGIVYGSSSGVGRTASVSQNATGVPGGAEDSDLFGEAVAVGDLNKDGYSDLVVGTPYEQVGEDVAGGTVVIVWGSSSGLKGATTVKDPAPTKHDRWGQALAVGDFTGDGRPDLAVGATGTTQWIIKGGFTKAGATGAKITYTTSWTGSAGVRRLTSGKINTDTKADLVVGGRAKIGTQRTLDHNFVYFGTSSAPTKRSELPYGTQVAIADLNKDGYGDVVSGWTQTATGSDQDGNGPAVVSYLTSSASVSSSLRLPWPGIPSVGDINGDGYKDLALGDPDDSTEGGVAGAVHLHYGKAAGLTADAVTLTQNSAGVPGAAETNDFFGEGILLTDLTKDGKADLLAAANGENEMDGLVTVLKGSATGITTSGAKTYGPSAFGISTADDPRLGSILAG
ncbi:integrin-like protein [Streptomyces sp. SA15]|uniref:FG-GAP-like repeat-containing protein n=1 Tax=Streptomyces sp. SA15 TaxID=934019 RepID=UPI000BB09268|nr:FG-GAP-like repeat-containing protein [Streptomyces sp. SA15]PAZ13979.1 integrin-like protein [Streptomyces sp. SA15]